MAAPAPRRSAPARLLVAAVGAATVALQVVAVAPPARAATGSVSINNASQNEGDVGSRHMAFTVTRSGGTGAFAVNYTTHDTGSATDGKDFVGTTGTLFFGANQNTATLNVDLLGDVLNEDNETFTVELTGPTNGVTLGAAPIGTGTILDDDGPPSVSIADVTTAKESGTASFPVTLSAPSGLPITVSARTTGVGTATAGADYQATVTNLSFNPGETAKTFVVPLIDDTVHEPDETFQVVITSTDATIERGSATGTVTDDVGVGEPAGLHAAFEDHAASLATRGTPGSDIGV